MDAAFEANPDLKMLFICSPGNPTGTLIPLDAIKRVLDNPKFKGVVVVDEAYIDFAGTEHSAAYLVNEYANVCVTQTLSKGFGLAAIRYVTCHRASIAHRHCSYRWPVNTAVFWSYVAIVLCVLI